MTNDELRLIAKCSGMGEIEQMEEIIGKATAQVEFHDHTLRSTIAQLIGKQQYNILDKFISKGFISTDLYDFERFDLSTISTLVNPMLHEDLLDSYLVWFGSYLQQIDDIDEEVAGITLLEYALQANAPIPLLKEIVAAGADVHRIDQYGQTILYKTCQLRMPANDRIEAVVDWLLAAGVDPNLANVEQKTALHMAVDTVKIHVVKRLLTAGADPSLQDWHGESVFYYAAVRQFNAILLEELLNFGTPDFHQMTKQGENLLNAFLRMMHTENEQNIKILFLLLEHGANLEDHSLWYQKEKTGVDWLMEKSAVVLQQVIDRGYLTIDYIDNDGNTLLHKACQVEINYDESKARDLYKKAKYLVSAGVDPQAEDSKDKKAVDYAMGDNLKIKTVEWLLKQ